MYLMMIFDKAAPMYLIPEELFTQLAGIVSNKSAHTPARTYTGVYAHTHTHTRPHAYTGTFVYCMS